MPAPPKIVDTTNATRIIPDLRRSGSRSPPRHPRRGPGWAVAPAGCATDPAAGRRSSLCSWTTWSSRTACARIGICPDLCPHFGIDPGRHAHVAAPSKSGQTLMPAPWCACQYRRCATRSRHPNDAPRPDPTRLVRRSGGRIVGGVAGGIADHLGVDAFKVRVAFVLSRRGWRCRHLRLRHVVDLHACRVPTPREPGFAASAGARAGCAIMGLGLCGGVVLGFQRHARAR